MAPEQFLIGAFHDAFIRIKSLGIHDRNNAAASAFEFIRAWIQYLQGMSGQGIALVAEHVGQGVVAGIDNAVLRHAHTNRRMHENIFVVDNWKYAHKFGGTSKESN